MSSVRDIHAPAPRSRLFSAPAHLMLAPRSMPRSAPSLEAPPPPVSTLRAAPTSPSATASLDLLCRRQPVLLVRVVRLGLLGVDEARQIARVGHVTRVLWHDLFAAETAGNDLIAAARAQGRESSEEASIFGVGSQVALREGARPEPV